MIGRFRLALAVGFSICSNSGQAASILYPGTAASIPSTGNTGISIHQGKRGIFLLMQCFDGNGRPQTDCWPVAGVTPSLKINGTAIPDCVSDPTLGAPAGQCAYIIRPFSLGGQNDTFDIVYNGTSPANASIAVTVRGATGNAGSAESTCPDPGDPGCTLSFTVEANPPTSPVYVVLFASPDINPAGQAVIEAAANQYRSAGSVPLQINGYADISSSEAVNLRLSERRATQVATGLAQLGVRRSDMTVTGKGASNPALNDRVEIVFP